MHWLPATLLAIPTTIVMLAATSMVMGIVGLALTCAKDGVVWSVKATREVVRRASKGLILHYPNER